MGRPQTTVETILARLDRSGGPDACWEWPGSRFESGYGMVSVAGRTVRVHRFIARHLLGDVDGQVVRHSCDNRPCCNPRHLLIGTHADNMRDMVERGRWHGGVGENHGQAKLTQAQVDEIRARLAAGERQADLAARFGTTQPNISHIKHGRTWAHA